MFLTQLWGYSMQLSDLKVGDRVTTPHGEGVVRLLPSDAYFGSVVIDCVDVPFDDVTDWEPYRATQ